MNVLNAHVDSTSKIVKWCALCGEKRPSKSVEGETIKSVTIAHTGYQNYYEIQINGLSVDMAYTYIAGLNLASYVNANSGMTNETAGTACDLQGVDAEL